MLGKRQADIDSRDLSHVHTYQLTLPYHGLPKDIRQKINENFHTWLKRQYGDWTYQRSEEIASGLIHRHYIAIFRQPIDSALVGDKWLLLVNSFLRKNRSEFQGKVELVDDAGRWTSYVLKANYKNPSSFVPPSWESKQPYRRANNWTAFFRVVTPSKIWIWVDEGADKGDELSEMVGIYNPPVWTWGENVSGRFAHGFRLLGLRRPCGPGQK